MTIETSGRLPPTPYLPPKVSWEDFHTWVLRIEGRAEWVDGEIIEIMPDNVRHLLLVDLISELIKNCTRGRGLGRVFVLALLMRLQHRPSGRVPDVVFISAEHLSRLKATYLDGPADLVVEVVSPDSEVRDRRDKLAEYREAGIPEYWLVDVPRQEARFYVLDAHGRYQEAVLSADGIYASTVVPGLRLRVEWLWRDEIPTLDEALADLPQ